MKKKWGIIPSEPIYIVGGHSIERFKKRVAKDEGGNFHKLIGDRLHQGTVLLERGNTRYVRSVDNIIFPCIKKGNKFVVKTTLPQEMNVFFANDRG